MAAKKKSTLSKVGDAVTGAAGTVATATSENVLKPVGRALGLVADKKKAGKKPAAKKSAAAKTTKPGTKKPAAKKATAAKKPAAKRK